MSVQEENESPSLMIASMMAADNDVSMRSVYSSKDPSSVRTETTSSKTESEIEKSDGDKEKFQEKQRKFVQESKVQKKKIQKPAMRVKISERGKKKRQGEYRRTFVTKNRSQKRQQADVESKKKTSQKSDKDTKKSTTSESNEGGSKKDNYKSGWRKDDNAYRLPSIYIEKALQPWKKYQYPLLYVSPHGLMSLIFREGIIVEMTIDRTIRVLCPGKFSAASNSTGSSNGIMHPQARMNQSETHVYCEFEGEKLAVFGSQGVIFTMKSIPLSYLVSSVAVNGTTPIPTKCIAYQTFATDFTLDILYVNSIYGGHTVEKCHQIVCNAKYVGRGENGSTIVIINGMYIKQNINGDLVVKCRPRTIRASPSKNTVSIRTHYVDMAVQENGKAFIKRGVKRAHVSRSGMVVSDGTRITSMDHMGCIVSST